MNEKLEYIFKPGDRVKSIPTGKIYTVEESVHEGLKVYLLPRQICGERLYNFAHELILIQEENNADIRKPEPEKPLIVKSGETWVLNNFGIDYLFLGHDITDIYLLKALFDSYNKKENELFKPFSEITLDDEIAKLRPMVTVRDNPNETEIHKLIFVNNQGCITMPDISEFKVNWNFGVELSTPQELNNLKEQSNV